MPEVTRELRVPRALEVPYPLGFPLGGANDPTLQTAVIRAAIDLLHRDDVPFIEPFAGLGLEG